MWPEQVLTEAQLSGLAEDIAERVAARVRPTEPLMSTREVAELLGVSDRYVRELVSGDDPEIPSLKIGGARRIERRAVEEFLEARRDAA